MSLKKNFGKRLKEIRKKKNMTQFQLAELSGIDEKHLSFIECGGSFPKADLIEKFAEILNVEPPEFFVFSHLKTKQVLLDEIFKKLKSLNEEDIRHFYKIIIEY